MRKTLTIGGIVAVLALIGGYLFIQWSERQVLAEVERQFVSLRQAGVGAEHGAVRVALRSRSVEIDDVKITASGAAGISATIARVKADGVVPAAATFKTAKLHLAGISVGGTVAGQAETRFTLTIPGIDIDGLETPASWPAAGGERSAAIGKVLQAIGAQVLAIPKLEMQATLPMPPQPPQPAFAPQPRRTGPSSIEISYVYSGVKLTGIADGRIAAVDVAEARFAGTTGSGTMSAISNRDLDLMPLFGVGLERRQPRDGFYRVQGKAGLGRTTIKMPDGNEFSLGTVTSGGMSIDPSRFTYAKLVELAAFAGNGQQPPSPQQITQMMERLAQIYEGVEVDAIEMRELSGTQPGGARLFTLAGGSLTGLTKGKLASMRIDGLDASLPPQPGRRGQPPQQVRIGGFEIKGFDFSGIFRKASTLRPGAQPPSPEEFLALIEGVEMTDAALPDPTSGLVNKIERVALAWGRPVNGVPADIRVQMKGELAVNPADPNMAMLRQLGFTSLAVDLDLGSAFDAVRRQLTLSPLRVKAGKLGALDARLVLGDVAPAAYSLLPARFAAALPAFAIRSLEVDYVDDGLLAVANPPATALPSGAARPDVTAALKSALIDPSQPPGNLSAIIDSLGLLLREGNKRMSVKLTANEIVRIGDFAIAGPGSPPGSLVPLIEKFALDVKVGK